MTGRHPTSEQLGGSWRNGSKDVCVSTTVSQFGMRTRFPPCSTGTLLSQGQLVGKKSLVQIALTTASFNGGVTSV